MWSIRFRLNEFLALILLSAASLMQFLKISWTSTLDSFELPPWRWIASLCGGRPLRCMPRPGAGTETQLISLRKMTECRIDNTGEEVNGWFNMPHRLRVLHLPGRAPQRQHLHRYTSQRFRALMRLTTARVASSTSINQ